MFVEAGAEWHEGGDDLPSLAGHAQRFVHDLGGDSLFSAGAAAMGFNGADVGDALTGDSAAADPHLKIQGSRGSDRRAIQLRKQIIAGLGSRLTVYVILIF